MVTKHVEAHRPYVRYNNNSSNNRSENRKGGRFVSGAQLAARMPHAFFPSLTDSRCVEDHAPTACLKQSYFSPSIVRRYTFNSILQWKNKQIGKPPVCVFNLLSEDQGTLKMTSPVLFTRKNHSVRGRAKAGTNQLRSRQLVLQRLARGPVFDSGSFSISATSRNEDTQDSPQGPGLARHPGNDERDDRVASSPTFSIDPQALGLGRILEGPFRVVHPPLGPTIASPFCSYRSRAGKHRT